MATTVATFLTQVRYLVKDAGSANYADAELMVYLNSGMRRIMRQCAWLAPDYWLTTQTTAKATSSLVANTPNYDLPSGFFAELAVLVKDSTGVLRPKRKLSLIDPRSWDEGGYYLLNDDIYLCPTPSAASASGLELYHVGAATEILVAGTATPFEGLLLDLLRWYCAVQAKARQKDGDPELTYFKKLYDEGWQQLWEYQQGLASRPK
jgi:hypothetical protein